jgi:flagellar biosynthesis GTPase FlhF
MSATKTFRASTLTDALAQVRAELGPDAVVVRRREGLHGGVAGFFQKAVVEIEAHPGTGIDLRDDSPALPDVAPTLARDAAAAGFAAALATATTNPDPKPYADPAIDAIPTARDSAPEVAPEPAATTPAPVAAQVPASAAHTAPAAGAPAPLAAEPAAPSGAAPAAPAAIAPGAAASLTASPALAPVAAPAFVAEPLAAPAPRPAAAPATHPLAAPVTHPEAARVLDALHRAGLSDGFAHDLLAEATDHGLPFADAPTALRPLVARALARRIEVAPLSGPGAVAVVGAAGSGKTAVVARLATAYAQAGRLPVAVIALRPKDGGAELARLLAPAGVPLSATDDVDGAAARIANLRRGALVLVDTPALPPQAGAQRDRLVADLHRLGLDEVHLTLPAILHGEVARDLLATGRELGVDRLAVTHADATARLGMALELAAEARAPVSYLADTSSVRPAAAEDLAFALLP